MDTNTPIGSQRTQFLAGVLVRCAAVHRVIREGRHAAHLGATTFTRLLNPRFADTMGPSASDPAVPA